MLSNIDSKLDRKGQGCKQLLANAKLDQKITKPQYYTANELAE